MAAALAGGADPNRPVHMARRKTEKEKEVSRPASPCSSSLTLLLHVPCSSSSLSDPWPSDLIARPSMLTVTPIPSQVAPRADDAPMNWDEQWEADHGPAPAVAVRARPPDGPPQSASGRRRRRGRGEGKGLKIQLGEWRPLLMVRTAAVASAHFRRALSTLPILGAPRRSSCGESKSSATK